MREVRWALIGTTVLLTCKLAFLKCTKLLKTKLAVKSLIRYKVSLQASRAEYNQTPQDQTARTAEKNN